MNHFLAFLIMKGKSRFSKYGVVQLVLIFLLVSCSRGPAQSLIAIDEVGYRPGDPKIAFTAVNLPSGARFEVLDTESLQPVYKGSVIRGKEKNRATGDVIHTINFTELRNPGTYQIWLPDLGIRSDRFDIRQDIYSSVITTAMESFYYQRCGTEVDNGTRWHHAACHLDDAVFYDNPSDRKDVTGGWHDAGDYGKFVVTTSVSLAFQLYLYEHQPGKFTDGQLNIPENSNGIPDLLDQARRALEWLLKMQRDDGGVYHKIQKKKWTGEYLPQNDPDRRYIYEVSSTATGDFAAAAALGARLFKPVDSSFAEELQKAAEHSWMFLQEHQDMVPAGGFKNPPDVKGGEYGDHKDSDERLWAAAELYRLTGSDSYHEYVRNHYRQLGGPGKPPVSWKNVSQFGYYSYLRMPESQQDLQVRTFLLTRLSDYADQLLSKVSDNGYRIALSEEEYYWGSNSVVLGYAFDLVQAHEVTGMKLYEEAALDQLHYILGRNAFGISFVTGVGANAAENPYHQFSMLLNTDKPVPGMVVGGPNSQNKLQGKTLSEYPGKAYEDNEKNYVVNETAINYTAPLVYLAGYFSGSEASISSVNK